MGESDFEMPQSYPHSATGNIVGHCGDAGMAALDTDRFLAPAPVRESA
jgi:hypothetical protein